MQRSAENQKWQRRGRVPLRGWLGLLTLSGLAVAGHGAELPADWRSVQSFEIDRAGLVTVSMPLASLDAARPGLEDLRLFDANGRELPFTLEQPVEGTGGWRDPKSFRVTLETTATVATAETGVAQPIEGIQLVTPARDFLKGLRLEGSQDGQRWETLVQAEPLFQQPDGARKLSVRIPTEVWAWLRVTLDDQRAAPIPVSGLRVRLAGREPAPAEPVDVRLVEREEKPGQTVFTLLLAGANVTLAGLELDVTDPVFRRTVELARRVVAENEVSETVLAQGTIYRLAGEGQTAVSNLVFAVDTPVPSRELRLRVLNGDSPPLSVSAIRARRRPVQIAWLAAGPGTFHLLTGNRSCAAPRYDLAGLQRDLRPTLVVPRVVRELAPNPAFRMAEPVPELAELGTALDVSKWKHRKRVQLAKAGVQQMELDPEALSRVGGNFGQLRLVRGGRQLPYLVERAAVTRTLNPAVEVVPDPKRPTVSRWALRLPQPALPIQRLTCETDAPFFRRSAVVQEEVTDERGNPYWTVRGQGSWVRELGGAKGRLSLSLNGALATDRLWLEVENGDNPPLALQNFQVEYVAPRLFFKSGTDGETFLYYGNREAGAPTYDIELVAAQLLSAEKVAATLAAEEGLRKSAWADWGAHPTVSRWALWSVLGLVVVGLLYVIARLLPKPNN